MAFCAKCGGANDPGASFCKACGAPLVSTATTPGPPPVPIVVVKKSGAGKVLLVLFAVFAGLVVIGFLIASLAGVNLDSSKKEVDPCDDNSYSYLYYLQHGQPSAAANYWKPGVTPQNLIDVHSFTFVVHGPALLNGKPYKVPRVYYQYEVESSNAMGMPIRRRWDIDMEHDSTSVAGKHCAIVAIKPI